MDISAKYPGYAVTLEGLSLRVRGAKGPTEDALLAREMACEISDEALWRYNSWWLPAQPEVADGLRTRLGAVLPADAEARCEWLLRVREARVRANRWRRELTTHERYLWIKKQGLIAKPGFEPMQHQITSLGFGLQVPVWGAFLDTGLGKTAIMAHLFQVLKLQRGAGPFLVVAPKTLLREAWGVDVERHTSLSWLDIGDPPAPEPMTKCPACGRDFVDKPVPKSHLKTHLKKRLDATDDKEAVWNTLYAAYPGLRATGAIGYGDRVDGALARTDIDVYVINPERAKICIDALKAKKFAMISVDESSMMRAHNSQTTQALIDLGWTSPRRCVMSGTPRPNSNLELWGQFAMMDGCFSHVYECYKQKYFQIDATGFKWFTRPGMDAKISDMIEDRTVRFRLKDCVDLPDETNETHEVELGEELRGHYKSMLEDMIVELEAETVSTPYKLVQINKLAQITSGFIYDKEGNVRYLSDGNPKLVETVSTARQLVEDEGRSVVIWIRFSEMEAQALSLALGKYGVSVMVGGMSSDKIQKSSQDFKSGENKIMVAHPLSAKFGHTWTHATACIWHSYDFSWENYYQGNHRIYRISQKQPVTYINIVARKTVDKIIMRALSKKEGESAVVIDRQFIKDLRGTL